jgi:hypothetical protein
LAASVGRYVVVWQVQMVYRWHRCLAVSNERGCAYLTSGGPYVKNVFGGWSWYLEL